MWKVALNKKTVDEIKFGIAETVKKGIVWPPNLPKFIDLCEGGSDETESFDRFIERKSVKCFLESLARTKVGYKCRCQLPEDKARKLWSETIRRLRQKLASGEISEPDPNAVKIDTPEAMKKTLTPEQRNQQLDRQLDEMLKNGTRLIGPFNKRYQERLKEGRQ